MSDDVLSKHTTKQVAAFYKRLGLAAAARGKQDKLETSLASDLLLMWLNVGSKNRNPYLFAPPRHLRQSRYVLEALKYHRAVFLSEEKARRGGVKKTKVLAGLIPRLQDGRWNGTSPISMHDESLVEVPLTVQARAYMGIATPGDFDILTSLRGFQLRSEVMVKGVKQQGSKNIGVTFVSYKARVKDTYDWNYNEYFTVPNPDYKKTGSDVIAPKQEKVRVYHSNAKRVEDANLAKPFKLESKLWRVTNNAVTKAGNVLNPK